MKTTLLSYIFILFSFNLLGQKSEKIGFIPLINGTEYKITTSNTDGVSPQIGDIIKISLDKFDSKGLLIFSTTMLDAPNGVEMILNKNILSGDIMDVFLRMKPGESAEAFVPIWLADNIELLKEDTAKYYYQIHLFSFKTQAENKKEQDELLVQLRAQQKILFDSISSSLAKDYKIYYQNDGLYILIDKKSKVKKKDFIQSNETVKVNYILQLLPDMKELDNSYLRGIPLEFKVGNQQVIQGWDIAIQKLNPRMKAILLIPSWLGYGFHGTGREIGPNTPLLFKLEIL
jgi:FKBP-type peptidyl-prolyl cis-trans isomerase